MGAFDLLNDREELAFFGAEDRVGVVLADDLFVGRDLDDVKLVDLLELLFLGLGGTGHAGQLVVQTEEVLEGDGRKGLTLTLDLDALFRLDRLMQTFVVASAVHQSAGELVDDDDLTVLDDVVDLVFHAAVGFDRLVDVVLDGDVVGIGEVLEVKEFLRFLDAELGQGRGVGFFVDNVVDAVILIEALEVFLRVDLGENMLFHRAGKLIGALVKVRRLVALAGDDQRGTRFINQNGVDLVDNSEGVLALDFILFVDDHVVAQIVKAELVVGAVGDVGGIGFFAFVALDIMNDQTDRESEEAVELAYPLGVTLCQIVVDRDDVDALAGQAVEVGGQGRDEGLTFTGFHLGETSLMQDDAADDLYGEVLHPKHTPRRFAAYRKCVGQDVVGGLAVTQSFLEKCCLFLEFAVGHLLIFALKRTHRVADGTDAFELLGGIITEDRFE